MRALHYNACMDVIDSDHKPVWALLALDVPVTDQHKKRRMCSHFLKQSFEQETAAAGKPALQMSCETVRLSQVGCSMFQRHSMSHSICDPEGVFEEIVGLSQVGCYHKCTAMGCEARRLSQVGWC